MALWRWHFYDPINDVDYELELNPFEGGTRKRKKRFTRVATTAPEGRTIIFQGQDEPETDRWSGVILSQTHFDALNEWYEKNHQIRVTDDLGRISWIVIDEFDATRVNSHEHPWKHKYTLNVTILNWEE